MNVHKRLLIFFNAYLLSTRRFHIDSFLATFQRVSCFGRSISDNTRLLKVADVYSKQTQTDSCIISLDAKKAFDSVDFEYLRLTLEAYGFGDGFIHMFDTIYSGLQASVMVNGHSTDRFSLARGVKQGDALSCGLFILAIDPLLRNIDANPLIPPLTFAHRHSVDRPQYKLAAYADDVAVITMNDRNAISQVFHEYTRLAHRCGLILNADKTEIYCPCQPNLAQYNFDYNDRAFNVQSVPKIIICGIQYGHDEVAAYDYNIKRRINKMEQNFVAWSSRHLTLNGRVMIGKTFGISQIIYAAGTVDIDMADINLIERLFYKFVWTNGWDKKSIDRIKRSYLKLDKMQGGLNAIDAKALNASIKVRNLFRIMNNDQNYIFALQKWLILEGGNPANYYQEFEVLSTFDQFTSCAQKSLNDSTAYFRTLPIDPLNPSHKDLLNLMLQTDLRTFARKNNYPMLQLWLLRMQEPTTSLASLFDSRLRLRPDSYLVCNFLPQFFKNLQPHYQLQQPTGDAKFVFKVADIYVPDVGASTKFLQIHFKEVYRSTEEFAQFEEIPFSCRSRCPFPIRI